MTDFQLFLLCLGVAGILCFGRVLQFTPNQKSKHNKNQLKINKTHRELENLMASIKTTRSESLTEHEALKTTQDEMIALMAEIKIAHSEVCALKDKLREENYLHEQVLRGLLIEANVLNKLILDFPSSEYILSSLVTTDIYASVPTSILRILAICKHTGKITHLMPDGQICQNDTPQETER